MKISPFCQYLWKARYLLFLTNEYNLKSTFWICYFILFTSINWVSYTLKTNFKSIYSNGLNLSYCARHTLSSLSVQSWHTPLKILLLFDPISLYSGNRQTTRTCYSPKFSSIPPHAFKTSPKILSNPLGCTQTWSVLYSVTNHKTTIKISPVQFVSVHMCTYTQFALQIHLANPIFFFGQKILLIWHPIDKMYRRAKRDHE